MPLTSGTIKFISSLRQKKVRQNYHKFTAEGGRIVGELLRQERYRVDALYALPAYAEETDVPARIPLTVVSERELSRISQLTTPNQVLAVVDLPAPEETLPSELATGWSLYLDGVQSPANLGALLRIADWFGFHHVIGGPGTADLYGSKSVQASMGSFLRVDYRTGTLEDVGATFPELPLLAADLAGESIFDFQPPTNGMLIVGAEGPGISRGARTRAQRLLRIPPGPGRRAESLNVAVATGILAAHLTRP